MSLLKINHLPLLHDFSLFLLGFPLLHVNYHRLGNVPKQFGVIVISVRAITVVTECHGAKKA